MSALIMTLVALSARAEMGGVDVGSPRAAPEAVCLDAISQLGAKVVIVAPPACSSADPTCATLQEAARSVQHAQVRARDKAVADASKNCGEYEKLVLGGLPEPEAWKKAMRGCGDGVKKLTVAFFSCFNGSR